VKVIAINGSPKKEGNTYYALKTVLDVLEENGIETEIVRVGHLNISGCKGCGGCFKQKNMKCVIDDDANEIFSKLTEADGVLLGSPVYYSGVNGTMKSFLDRAFYVIGANGGGLRHKVGASLAVVRRSGGIPTTNELNHFLQYSQMIMPTSNYWHVIHGASPKEVLEDEEGILIAQTLGDNMAWIMKSIDASKDIVKKPEQRKKIWTNFIR